MLYIYIYIIYTPNLGLVITVLNRVREQGRFRGSIKGAWGSTRGVRREQGGAAQEHSTREPELAVVSIGVLIYILLKKRMAHLPIR